VGKNTHNCSIFGENGLLRHGDRRVKEQTLFQQIDRAGSSKEITQIRDTDPEGDQQPDAGRLPLRV
jgi:hypothetical protein